MVDTSWRQVTLTQPEHDWSTAVVDVSNLNIYSAACSAEMTTREIDLATRRVCGYEHHTEECLCELYPHHCKVEEKSLESPET